MFGVVPLLASPPVRDKSSRLLANSTLMMISKMSQKQEVALSSPPAKKRVSSNPKPDDLLSHEHAKEQ